MPFHPFIPGAIHWLAALLSVLALVEPIHADPLRHMREQDAEVLIDAAAAPEPTPMHYVSFDFGGRSDGTVQVGRVKVRMSVKRYGTNLQDFRLEVFEAGKRVLTHWSRQRYDFAAQITRLDPTSDQLQVLVTDMDSPQGEQSRGFLYAPATNGHWQRVATPFIRTGGAFALLARDLDGDGVEEITASGHILRFSDERWLSDALPLASALRVWGMRHGRVIERTGEARFRFVQGKRLAAFYAEMGPRVEEYGINPESTYLKADVMGYLAAKAHLGELEAGWAHVLHDLRLAQHSAFVAAACQALRREGYKQRCDRKD